MMHFTVWLEDGTFLFSSFSNVQPVEVEIGSEQLFPAWEEGVRSMSVGSTRQLVIPPGLAPGDWGLPDSTIPPSATLIMEIELLALRAGG